LLQSSLPLTVAPFLHHQSDVTKSHDGLAGLVLQHMVKHYIGIITSHAQTMLLHTMSTWPEIITSKFWSFAVKHIIWLHNMKPIPAKNNQCPSELFTGKAPPHHISNFCIFGCPAYILKKNLADDNSIPKWKAQAYRGIFIGHSKQHSSSVATHQQNWFQPNITYFLTKALKQWLLSMQHSILMNYSWHFMTNCNLSNGCTLISTLTKLENTLHNYFDGDWNFNSCLYNTKQSAQPHQLTCPTESAAPAINVPDSQHKGALNAGTHTTNNPKDPSSAPVSQLNLLTPPNPKH